MMNLKSLEKGDYPLYPGGSTKPITLYCLQVDATTNTYEEYINLPNPSLNYNYFPSNGAMPSLGDQASGTRFRKIRINSTVSDEGKPRGFIVHI